MFKALSVLVTAAALSGSAFASEKGVYVSGQGGVAFLPQLHMGGPAASSTDSFAAGRIVGTAIGYDDGGGWRYEMDWAQQNSDLARFNGVPESGHLRSMGLMANITYDLTQGARLTPYIGAGIGAQWISGSVHGYTGSAWRPAYQLRTGARFEITPHSGLFVEYRFAQSASLKLSDAATAAKHEFSEHAVMLGITFHTGLATQVRFARIAEYFGINPDLEAL